MEYCEIMNELNEIKAKLKDAGWDCVDDVINAEKEYEEKCKRLETERLQKELIKSVANATYGIPSVEHSTKLEENGKCQNELKEIKTKLKDAGWDCVDDVINAEKEYEEKCKKLEKDNEFNVAIKTAVNAIYGKHNFEHITKLEEKCKKLEEELKHYYELNTIASNLGFNDIEKLIVEHHNLKRCLRLSGSLFD